MPSLSSSVTSDIILNRSNWEHSIGNDHYILKINPNYKTNTNLKNNKIDARYIDTATGRFIDITCIYASYVRKFRDKSKHSYFDTDLFPLHAVPFLGGSTFVPNKVIITFNMRVINHTDLMMTMLIIIIKNIIHHLLFKQGDKDSNR